MRESEASRQYRRYLQSLDSAAFRLEREENRQFAEATLLRQREEVVKLHALFGGSLAITNLNPVDSLPVVALFESEPFRNFLAGHPSFLQVVDVYRSSKNLDRRRIMNDALDRVLEPEFVSSFIPTDPTAQIELARALLDARTIDPGMMFVDRRKDRVGGILARWPEHAARLSAVVYAVDHFVNDRNAPVALSEDPAPDRFYGLLKEALDLSDAEMPSKDRERVEHTIDFIDDKIKDTWARGVQSVVFAEGESYRREILSDVKCCRLRTTLTTRIWCGRYILNTDLISTWPKGPRRSIS